MNASLDVNYIVLKFSDLCLQLTCATTLTSQLATL